MAKRQAGQPELRVEYVPTAELVPYAGNAKEHPEWQVGQIVQSIKEFGFSDPIGAWHDSDLTAPWAYRVRMCGPFLLCGG